MATKKKPVKKTKPVTYEKNLLVKEIDKMMVEEMEKFERGELTEEEQAHACVVLTALSLKIKQNFYKNSLLKNIIKP